MQRHYHQLELGRWLMACQFQVLLNAGLPPEGAQSANEALDCVDRLEASWSVYRSDSELSRLNEINKATPENLTADTIGFYASSDTLDLIEIARSAYDATQGCFDITSHRLSEVWGFANRQGRMPAPEEIRSALFNVDGTALSVDRAKSQILLSKRDLKLNPGGIGKGLAIDKAMQVLRSDGVEDAVIHGGHSSVSAIGNRFDIGSDRGWQVSVSHPYQPREKLGILRLTNTALGTSGHANQFFYFGGKRYGHIIHPRTGYPIEGMLSMTVLHRSAAWADALATGFYVAGVDAAASYCSSNPDVGFLAILPTSRQGTVEVITSNLEEDVWTQARG